jgi:hypothetical protein
MSHIHREPGASEDMGFAATMQPLELLPDGWWYSFALQEQYPGIMIGTGNKLQAGLLALVK